MELVINKCFGGFSLSVEAENMYAEKKGLSLYRYKMTKCKHRDGIDEFSRIESSDVDIFSFAFTKDHGDRFNDFPNDGSLFCSRDIERNDPVLVDVVRTLGDAADGNCASLDIVDIPDGVEYEISEYDGQEHVAEAHRTWG